MVQAAADLEPAKLLPARCLAGTLRSRQWGGQAVVITSLELILPQCVVRSRVVFSSLWPR